MRRTLACAAVLVCLAGGAGADAPASSVRPRPNPITTAGPTGIVPEQMGVPEQLAAPEQTAAVGLASGLAPATSLRPLARPAGGVERTAAAPSDAAMSDAVTPDPAPADPAPTARVSKKKPSKASNKGSVCDDPAIKGEALAPIKAKVKGCGLDKPVRVTSISGIRLNQPATINCDTATAMKRWINAALLPAMGNRQIVEIRIAASYICRSRNNKKGAKISEHGRGKALDVAGLVFSDGSEWSVAKNYNKQIRRAHKDACGIFGTTLGPGSDGYHEDHLHFDTASYKGGPYCR